MMACGDWANLALNGGGLATSGINGFIADRSIAPQPSALLIQRRMFCLQEKIRIEDNRGSNEKISFSQYIYTKYEVAIELK